VGAEREHFDADRRPARGREVAQVRDQHEAPDAGGAALASIPDLRGPLNGHITGTGLPQVLAVPNLADRSTDTQSTAPLARRGGARERTGPLKRWTPAADGPRRLLTLAEAAAYLGVSPWTVRDLQWKGRLPRVALSRKLLFDLVDLDRLIEATKE
jgi:excisionase family DNA binding protein